MEPREIYVVLRRRWLWLMIVGAAAGIVALSTGWHAGAVGFREQTRLAAVAQAAFLVDTSRSSLVDISQDTFPLSIRAKVYAQFMRSNTVRLAIARRAGIPTDDLVIDSPTTAAGGTQNIPRPAPARANEVVRERTRYRLAFTAQPGLPVVSVSGQAPTTVEAINLVDAAVDGFARYLRTLEAAEHIPTSEQSRVVSIGSVGGAVINARADLAVAMLAFLVVLTSGCLLIVAGDAVAPRYELRRRRNAFGLLRAVGHRAGQRPRTPAQS